METTVNKGGRPPRYVNEVDRRRARLETFRRSNAQRRGKVKMKTKEKAVMHVLALRGLQWVLDGNADLAVSIPNAQAAAMAVMHAGGISLKLARMIMHGPGKYNLADGELGQYGGGLDTCYDGYIVHNAAKIALRRASGDRRVEIGMKYPVFNLETFIDKFHLTFYKSVTPRSVSYDVWVCPRGNVWSFGPGRTGGGGYAGAVFVGADEAMKWLRFLLRNPEHYIKDINIGYNNLGGLGVAEWDELQKEVNIHEAR